jgi:predicted Holliday junction resolvase-like endonuclease
MADFPAIIYFTVAFILLILIIALLIRRIRKLKSELQEKNKLSLQNQRSKLKGEISGQLAPLLPDFPVDASDVFHFGGGVVDFIAFEGISNGNVEKIWFIDSKYNQSSLNNAQRQIEKIINELHGAKPSLIEFKIYDPKKGTEIAFRAR